MKFKSLFLALFFALMCLGVNAQESHGGKPLSFIRTNELKGTFHTLEMPAVDAVALMKEDEENVGKDMPYRFGFNHYGFYTPENCGTWTTLKTGERVWRLGIKCPEALSINIAFAQFVIPEGAKLFLYNKTRDYVLGSFTSKNMQPDGQFGVDLVPGDEIVVEYNEPAKAEFKGQLNIFRITHGYRDLFKIAKAFGDAGNCHNNVICPEGNPWRNEISSVALIVVNGSGACTGALINNANQDARPFFLTANHCLGGSVTNWVFRFNYQSATCTPSANGPTNQTVSGATLRASASGSDFALLELNSAVPQSYNVCYSGWSRSNVPPTSGACIHHPSGDIKKISFSTTAFDSTAWSGNTENHWLVQWSDGVTEPGSSGSPMYDQNKRIVGQLHGGPSFCGASQSNLNDDYGKIFYSWNKMGNNANQRLQNWLDPSNTGLLTTDTYCPGQVALNTYDAKAVSVILPTNAACQSDFIPQLIVTNMGTQTITSLNISWVLDGGTAQSATINSLSIATNATDTIALPQITFGAGNHTYSATIVQVNGQADQGNTDNTASGNFTSTAGFTYNLTVTADDYAEETGFYIVDANQNEVFGVDPGTLAANSINNYNICLPAGCYTFIVVDAFGDGMCCDYGNGSFELTDGSSFVIASGGDFGYQQNFPFCTTLNTNDAAIDAILAPGGTQCYKLTEPVIIIRNQGSQPLTDVTIGYSLNGGTALTYTWTGNLVFNQTDTVTLPTFDSGTTPNVLTIYTYLPNNQADANTGNDTLDVSFAYFAGNAVTLNYITDDYPVENEWRILNANNTVVAQNPSIVPSAYLPASQYDIALCLPNGCYKFIITDSEGDGICCGSGDGSATLLTDNNDILGSVGQFADADTIQFCLPFVGIEEELAGSVNVFPNPATGNVYIVFGELVTENLTIELINTVGQVVKTTNVQNANMANVSVTGLANGFYMLRMYGEKTKPYTTTVVVKN